MAEATRSISLNRALECVGATRRSCWQCNQRWARHPLAGARDEAQWVAVNFAKLPGLL